MKVYSLGYGGPEPQEFLDILCHHNIRTIADVRLRPQRASMGSYTLARTADKGLQSLLARKNIYYQWLPGLGNVFFGLPDWKLRYSTLLKQSGELLAERLSFLTPPFCLLCAEKAVHECHRQCIAEYLERCGHEIQHIG